MQAKISSFFKPTSSPPKRDPPSVSLKATAAAADDSLDLWEKAQHFYFHQYKRRSPTSDTDGSITNKPESGLGSKLVINGSGGKVLNKKRSYAQFYLDLGQSDFNLRRCSTCGFGYAPGDDVDEKQHKTFHKNYTHGIPHKVLKNESVIQMECKDGGRVIEASGCDSISQRNKVEDVIRMMEIELGDGWILHKLCRVYMYVSSQRVAGCLVAEPIKEAFEVLSSSVDTKPTGSAADNSRSVSTTLKFGEIVFQREATRKLHSANLVDVTDGSMKGAIICKEEAVPTACGIRAIWVTPSNRRKRIASQLLDAARTNFCPGVVLERSGLAFSPPTAAGKALASKYTGTSSFLVYKPDA